MTVVAINGIGYLGERTGQLRLGLTAAALGYVGFGVAAWAAGLGTERASFGPEEMLDNIKLEG